ncbi:hypothetical protein [Halorarius litoreus]|uniref:hypothetical protein n=1 Tax=Halorarius litoreus TaxID=2962676 RepID=UPI0020CBAB25|nr:hypothetical protein [Halorarius litoreus]
MGLFDWLRGLFSRGDGRESGVDAPADATLRCTVCGTTTGPDATECPLCHGSDLAPLDGADTPADGSDLAPLDGADTPADGSGDDAASRGPAPTRDSHPGTTDDDAGRLREIRERHGEE